MYYFVRLYEYYDINEDNTKTEQEKEEFLKNHYYNYDNRELIDENVFEAEDREKAKEYCKNTYGNYPFKLSKNNKVNGHRYFYLCDSSSYWYEYHHKEVHIICDYCHKETVIIGLKNQIYNRFGEYCSRECCNKHYDELVNTIENEGMYISETDHLGIPKDYDDKLVGYIYKITNKYTLKCYIGKTIKPPLFRWWQHLKVDGKFERANVSDLVFEVLEIVTYDEEKEKEKYKCGADKLSDREAHFINLYNCIEEGYNIKKETEKDLLEEE